jgi:predicted small lipoprotein YifL
MTTATLREGTETRERQTVRIQPKAPLLLASLIVAAASLSACGLKGDLNTPPPLWGDKTRAVTERKLPGGNKSNNKIVFTREDVEVFQPPKAPEDPFAVPPDSKSSSQVPATGGVAPPEQPPTTPPGTPPAPASETSTAKPASPPTPPQ